MPSKPHPNSASPANLVLHTDRFSFEPLWNGADRGSFAPEARDAWLRERFKQGSAGPVFFHDPGIKWESMEQDQIVRTHPVEWALARLLFLLRQKNPQVELAALLQIEGTEIRLPLIVRDGTGQIIAQLALTAAKYEVCWQGPARSYIVAKNACDELEVRMLKEPEQLAEYQIAVPWRKAMGWNGKRFLGQRIVRRPEFYSPEMLAARQAQTVKLHSNTFSEHSFRVTEYPRDATTVQSSDPRREFRYTDKWPPLEAWAEIPNWVHAYDEEGRSGQDETTLKPARHQTFVSDDVDYTIGQAWLADDQIVPAILGLWSGKVTRIACFEERMCWEFSCGTITFQESSLTPQQRARFPVRVFSRLSRSRHDPAQTIRVLVDERGNVRELERNDQ